MTPRSALYRGAVTHARFHPKAHRLRYAVFCVLLDLDELQALDSRLFGHNRAAPLSFHDRDHGARDGAPLRAWAEARMRDAGVTPDGGRIELLCYPRIFGYVFNPLSVFFCRRRDGSLAAILYEVSNTHGERHTYALPVAAGAPIVRQRAAKDFFVSPFMGPSATYEFRVSPPAENVAIAIRVVSGDACVMAAAFKGAREEFTAINLLRTLGRFPLMTLKVIAAIHWEAAKLWWKGFAVFPHFARSKS